MAPERRQDLRVKNWFDGSWQGSSGSSRCRLSDVSIAGCFVHSLAAPRVGERTTVIIDLGPSHSISIESDVVYVEPTMGFGVKFQNVGAETLTQLQRLIDTHKKASA